MIPGKAYFLLALLRFALPILLQLSGQAGVLDLHDTQRRKRSKVSFGALWESI